MLAQPPPLESARAAGGLPFEVAPPLARAPAEPRTLPWWRALLVALLNPGGARTSDTACLPWPLTLTASGLAFGLFFLQTGLDRLDTGTITGPGVGLLAALGLAFGTLGVVSLALVAWIALSLSGSRATPPKVIRAFALAYNPSLVALVLGLGARWVLGWRTAMAFGLPGMLWALGPLNSALRRLSGGKTLLGLVLASACGGLLLLGWGLLGGL